MNFIEQLQEARRVSAPLVYIITPDPAACLRRIAPALELPDDAGKKSTTVISWDPAEGMRPWPFDEKNTKAETTLAQMIAACNPPPGRPQVQGAPQPQVTLAGTTEANVALKVASKAPTKTVVAFHVLLPQAFFLGPKTVQQIWNLRDTFKTDFCMLIFLGPDVTLPAGLANDVMVLTEPQPELEDLKGIVRTQHGYMKDSYPEMAPLSEEQIEKAALSVMGLSAFPAETAIAMTTNRKGIDLTSLRTQRYDRLDEVKGVSVWRGRETFADIGGCDGIKSALRRTLTSTRKKAGPVFFLDEADKMLMGTGGGDLSGMADTYLGLLLSYMQDHKVLGYLFLGPPGTSKTFVSKAAGNEFDRICMSVNLNLMKNHLMGESEANLHRFFRLVTALSGGAQPVFILSCNRAAHLPTSLLRRCGEGRFFFDLPTPEERKGIWRLKFKAYNLADQPLPDDDQWSGSEIDTCCDRAWSWDITVREAAEGIIPVALAAPEDLAELRAGAHMRYLNAATGKPYEDATVSATQATTKSGRRVNLPKAMMN